MFLAAIEGGGQSWVCALAAGERDNIVETVSFPTLDPDRTLGEIKAWLVARREKLRGIGIATFGPIDARPASSRFGYITSTPKEGWGQTDVLRMLGVFDELCGIPYRFDTDVNAPALSEYASISGISSCAYITVGTGIGVGLVVNGQTVHGMLHPEAGHMLVARKENDQFSGVCKFHRSCVEGMCSSVAVAARVGVALSSLPSLDDSHDVWDICAYYIAALCANIVLTVSPERIILGGGVMNRTCLYEKVRRYTIQLLNGYIDVERLKEGAIVDYITPSKWGSQAGIVGALYLAQIASIEKNSAPQNS